MQEGNRFPARLLILISLLQGLALLLLHQAIELKFWPQGAPEWLFSFYSMALVGPIMLMLGLKNGRIVALSKWVLAFTLLAGLLGYYVGMQATPVAHVRFDNLLSAFVFTMALATFKALMYAQRLVSCEKFSYSQLFRWSWRNFFTLGLALLFAGLSWGLLMLWAGLFEAIEIDFFADLMKYLLVLLVLVSILFLAALPISGLAPLWKSGGSHLILWMQALILFSVNAVYKDESHSRPYHLWLHRFIYFGVALLPIYSAISLYGLVLRIEQYGWSVGRCWAVLIWLFLACFSMGYLWGVIRRRDNWLQQLSKVNVAMGLSLLVAMLLINSPLLDFRKIAVASQLERLQQKKLLPKDFDMQYFRRYLARPGYFALQQVKSDYAESNPSMVVRINNMYSNKNENEDESIGFSEAEFLAAIEVVSGDMPPDLGSVMYQRESSNSRNMQNTKRYYLLPVNLDEDTQLEYLLVGERNSGGFVHFYHFEGGQWQQIRATEYGGQITFTQEFFDAIRAGKYELLTPRWKQLNIGGQHLQIREKPFN